MTKRTREIIALVVMTIIVVCGVVGFVWAMITGHNWNKAAMTIDEAAGNMSGYYVVVFDGTQPVEDEQTADASAPLSLGTLLSSSSSSQSSASSSDSTAATADASDDEPSSAGVDDEDETPLIDTVAQDYRAKQASVIKLDTANPEKYRDPLIVARNGKRFGIFYIDDSTYSIAVDHVLNYFENSKVDYVIVLSGATMQEVDAEGNVVTASAEDEESEQSSDSSASSSSKSSSAKTKLAANTIEKYVLSKNKVDVLISLSANEYSPQGSTVSGKFAVSSPDEGSVGALLISPSNVVSAKTVSE